MYMCIYIYVYTHVYIYICMYIYMYIHKWRFEWENQQLDILASESHGTSLNIIALNRGFSIAMFDYRRV